jgi:hypothetical protein
MVAGVVVVSPGRASGITWFEHRSCRSKVAHATRKEARTAARAVERRHGGRLEPYHCGFCDGWHVGHPMARR